MIGGLCGALFGGYLGWFVGLIPAFFFIGTPWEAKIGNVAWGFCVCLGFVGGWLLSRYFDEEITAGEASMKAPMVAWAILAFIPAAVLLLVFVLKS